MELISEFARGILSNSELISLQSKIGNAYYVVRDYEKAKIFLENLVNLYKNSDRTNNRHLLMIYQSLAEVEMWLGEYANAKKLLEHILKFKKDFSLFYT